MDLDDEHYLQYYWPTGFIMKHPTPNTKINVVAIGTTIALIITALCGLELLQP